MINLATIRNPEAERVGVPVVVSSQLCEKAGIALAYAGLFGIVVGVDENTGECLVSLDRASHERFVGIESKAFSKSVKDLDEDQWFVSGILEVVEQ